MINIYPPNAEDFSTLGLAALQPAECTIEEKAGGMLELNMKHPVDGDMKWTYLQNGCIIKAPCAVRDAPIIRISDDVPANTTQIVTRAIYRVRTNTGVGLNLRAKASTSSAVLSSYKPGTEVIQLSASGGWSRVVIKNGGATGWMSSQYLVFVRNETETVSGDYERPSVVVGSKQTREQLFRIYSVDHNADTGMVEISASHIFYDLSGVICTKDYKPENVAADTVLNTILANASGEHGFEFHCMVTNKISGDYTGVSIVKALLDPEIGIVAQTGARIIRDNYDVYILPDEAMDRGMEIRHRKNLLGAVLTVDVSGAATRIRPVGKNKDGNRLLITENNGWVQSPNIDLYPTRRDVEIAYDVSVSTADDAPFKNDAAARNELKRLAQQDFANGMDAAKVSLDVELAALENSAEYAEYAPLLTMFLYDTVHVIAAYVGIDARLRVNGYVYDCLTRRYQDVHVGDISELKQTTYGYEIANGSVSGAKILPGSVDANAVMRRATIGYALISQATVEQLAADALTAVSAHINQLVAGTIEADQLYADLAVLAAAQITAANIEAANINWAEIQTLTAQIASIAKAQINTANIESAQIDWAQIDTLNALIANIAQAKVDDLEVRAADIKDLSAVVAQIFNANIGSADIGFAQIKDLVAGTAIITQGVGGELYIARLAVTEANMVSLTVGELLLKNADGDFVRLVAGADGGVSTEVVQVEGGNIADATINGGQKIIEGSITAAVLNVQNIFADSEIVRRIIAENIDVGTLFARQAFIAELNATDIRGNQYLKITVDGLADDIAAAQAAADAAQESANKNAEDMANIVTGFNKDIKNLQTQIDGSITTWFYPIAPETDNPPANEWTTDDLKNVHLGDLYYDTVTGYCYRWQVLNNTYSWQRITDTDVTKALEDAAKAQDTADAKRRVFYAQPEPPYDRGDLWAQGADGELLRCQTSKVYGQSYAASDWVKASKYTDDTAANAAMDKANSNATVIDGIQTTITQQQTEINQTKDQLMLTATKAELTEAVDGVQADVTSLGERITTAEEKLTPEAITLTVQENLKLGGANLIRQEGVSVGWVDDTGALVADEGYRASAYIPVTPGEDLIFQIWRDAPEGYTLWQGVTYFDSDLAYIDGSYSTQSDPDSAALYMIRRLTAPEGAAYIRVSYRWSEPWSEVTPIGNIIKEYRVKLERGSVATDWSNAPEELISGTNVRITDKEFAVTVPKDGRALFAVKDASGEDETLRLDADGMHAQRGEFDVISSPSVVPTWEAGEYAPESNGDFAALLQNMDGHYLKGRVTVDASNVVGGAYEVSGLTGPGPLVIQSPRIAGLTVKGCSVPVRLTNPVFTTAGDALTAEDSFVTLTDGSINAQSCGIVASGFSRVIAENCTGSCVPWQATPGGALNPAYLAKVGAGSAVIFTGANVPYGLAEISPGGELYAAVPLRLTDETPTEEIPEIVQATLPATLTKTYDSSWRDGNDLYQGRYGTRTLNRGCMWFDLTAISGKTILSATLTLRRMPGAGTGSNLTANIHGTPATGASGTPGIGAKYASVSVAQNASKSVDVTSAVQALADGTIRGLMLYDARTTNGSGGYTAGYGKFYGHTSGYRPYLTVTYQ